jgi:hypothetical protein
LARQPSDYIENACRNTKDIYAFTVRQVILFCVGDRQKSLTDQERIRLRFVAGHEYAHVIQAQFLGYPLGGNARLHTARSGPLWLMEGSAQYFPSELSSYRKQIRRYVAQYRRKLPAELPDLADYETPQALKDDPEGVYKLGFLATLLLVQIANSQEIFEFYQRIGRGADWRQAFADSFGVTVAEFYETFRAL